MRKGVWLGFVITVQTVSTMGQIDELGIADDTYIFYTADNGYELKNDLGKPIHERGYYKAFPQRSHKYTVSEGGIRNAKML